MVVASCLSAHLPCYMQLYVVVHCHKLFHVFTFVLAVVVSQAAAKPFTLVKEIKN